MSKWLAIILLCSCSAPSNLINSGLDCGYVASDDSPYLNETDSCQMVETRTGLITTPDIDGCEVEERGVRCMVIAPGEAVTGWFDVWETDLVITTTSVNCDEECPHAN